MSYHPLSKTFHWVTAIAVPIAVALGIAMVSAAPGEGQNRLYDLHRSVGATVLALTGLRLMWRLYRPPPALLPASPWQQILAVSAHRFLYVLLFAVPGLGWAGTSAFGAPIWIFGLFRLPPILNKDQDLAVTLLGIHELAAFSLCAVFIVHAGAALHHHFVRRDATLRRMLG